MSDKAVIVLVAGAVVIVLIVLLRKRLARLAVDLGRGRIDASMKSEEPLSERGARARNVHVAGDGTVHDETGIGASAEGATFGGNLSVVAKPPGGDAKKR